MRMTRGGEQSQVGEMPRSCFPRIDLLSGALKSVPRSHDCQRFPRWSDRIEDELMPDWYMRAKKFANRARMIFCRIAPVIGGGA